MIELTEKDKKSLLFVARQTLKGAFHQIEFNIEEEKYPSHLDADGASFVTLTINGRLRGCIGTLTAYQSLVQDVCEHALAAAFQDPRFPPLSSLEFEKTEIEVSYLTPPTALEYSDANDLCQKLVPDRDGVILTDGFRKATYLPQVWDQLPACGEFLSSLCRKMGAKESLWKEKKLSVKVYQVIHFAENDFLSIP